MSQDFSSVLQDDILDKINEVTLSSVTGAPINITNYLGGLQKDGNRIVGARSVCTTRCQNILNICKSSVYSRPIVLVIL